MRILGFILLGLAPSLFGLELLVRPSVAAVHEKVTVEIKGLHPNQFVTCSASMKDEKGRVWKSKARFRSDKRGVVDLSKRPSIQGTYEGVEPMGLFWSMQLDDDEQDRSLFWHPSLEPMSIEIVAEPEGGEKEIKAKLIRQIVSKEVKKVPIREEGLVGTLFLPEGKGPFPSVIVLGGIEGGMPPDSYVVQLASQGYAALGLAYTGEPGVALEFADIPLEYFQTAINWLKLRKEIHPKRIALLGTSLGGVVSLLVASHTSDIKAVIALGGGGELFQPFEVDKSKPLFTYKNRPLAFLPYEAPYGLVRSLFTHSAEKMEEAAIPVEKINGPILMMAGLDDHIFGSAILSNIAYNRLKAKHFKYPYHLIVYNGVGHLNALGSLPYCPTTINAIGIKPGEAVCNLGGNPQDSAKAQIDTWRQLLEFLRRSF